jgi:tRNA(Ile)-lysidine synthase
MIQSAFLSYYQQQGWLGHKILVAISGGLDSMVLAALLKEAKVDFILAHCNFHLRGAESDGDEQLVQAWAVQNHIPLLVHHFDTKAMLEQSGGNLQALARNLRYQWFQEVKATHQCKWIATAHHQQDSVETLLINLCKGTGIAGLHGILPQQNDIIRPLLPFNKATLKEYALTQNLPWREDSSNLKDDYARNAMRHHVIPQLEAIFPQAVQQLYANTERWQEVEMLYEQRITQYKKRLLEQRGKDVYIPILKLKQVQPLRTILWELIKPFGFHAAQIEPIVDLLNSESGKYIASGTHRIIRNRNMLIITTVQAEKSQHILIEQDKRNTVYKNGSLKFEFKDFKTSDWEWIKKMQSNQVVLNADLLQFPLILRPAQLGDYFYPLGMGMKKKKVSKFLTHQKVPLHEKEQVWVLESARKIVWVIGHRIDERFKLKLNSTFYAHFSVNDVL